MTMDGMNDFQLAMLQVDKKIELANELEVKGQSAEALAAYQSVFDLAKQLGIPLYIHQLSTIWMGIGFCHANRHEWDEALRFYGLVEMALRSVALARQRQGVSDESMQAEVRQWMQAVPHDLRVVVADGFEPVAALSTLYESIALVYENTGRMDSAQLYYGQAQNGHQQLNNVEGMARIWYYQGYHAQRRKEWPRLLEVSQGFLQFAQQRERVNDQITAAQWMAQAQANLGRDLQALAALSLVVEIEQKAGHADLARDQQLLGQLRQGLGLALQKYTTSLQAKPQPIRPVPTSFRALPQLFSKIVPHKSVERGAPELLFVATAGNLETAVDFLRYFSLLPFPVSFELMRQFENPNAPRSQNADFRLEWMMSDILPGKMLTMTPLSDAQRGEFGALNAGNRRFSVVVEEAKGGLFSKPKREPTPFVYEAYVLDWWGVEGASVYAYSTWQQPTLETVDGLIRVLEQRVAQHGAATGLLTQIGRLHRFAGRFDAAAMYYCREIQQGLRADGTPGAGIQTAFCNLGTIYKKLQKFDLAILCYKLALYLNPNYFEPLVSMAGIMEETPAQLLCLSRAERLQPESPIVVNALQNFCSEFPQNFPHLLQIVRETSLAVDLSQPFITFVLSDPAAAVKRVLAGSVGPTAAPVTPQRGALSSLDEACRILEAFATAHSGRGGWNAAVENMTEFSKGADGKTNVTSKPGAVLQLASRPELIVRVILDEQGGTVRLMKEIQIPGVPQSGMKAVATQTFPAQAEKLWEALMGWVNEGALICRDGQWNCRE